MLTDFSNQLADVVAQATPSVVQVQGHRRPASGVVHSSQVVVTTMRAIGREDGLQVRADDGRVGEAELVGWDPATALAVLRVPGFDAPPIATSHAAVRVGQLAVAVARSWTNVVTASVGNVAVIGGPLRTGRRRAIEQVFRTTAIMHEGFAGGAFLDTTGGLIGISTAASIRGFGVVIPASIAWNTVSMILEHGHVKRGYLGLAGQPVTLADNQRNAAAGRERGLLVLAVTAGAPAATAGVLVGDVILALDDSAIESPEELMDLLLTSGAGRSVTLRVLRGTTALDLPVTVGDPSTRSGSSRAESRDERPPR